MFLFLLAVFIGILYAIKCNINIKQSLINVKINYNYYHILISALVIMFSYIFLAPIISTIGILIEGFSIGVTISYYVKYFYYKGLIYSFIKVLLSRFVYLILFIIIAINVIKIIKTRFISNKTSDFYKYIYLKNKYNIYLFYLILLNELIVSSLFSKIINYFSFLIK